MRQMAGETGIPFGILRHARESGCAFVDDHGRCEILPFLKWFFEQDLDGEDGIDWAKREKRAKALMKEVELEEAREESIKFATVERFISNLTGTYFFGELDRLRNEFPPSLKGKGEIAISEECDKQFKQVKKQLTDQMDSFIDTKGKAI